MAKRTKLTDKKIEFAKPELDAHGNPKLTYFFDELKPGLALVITAKGHKSWQLFYRVGGKQRKLTLDGFPSLATARQLAQAALDKIANGADPASEKQEERQRAKAGIPEHDLFPNVVRAFMKHYCAGRATGRRPPKESTISQTASLLGLQPDPDHKSQWLTIKRKNADDPKRPVEEWQDRRIQDIRKRDVITFLDAIVDRGNPYAANRLYAVLSPLFDWAVRRDLIEVSPVVWDKSPEEARQHELSNDEIRWFWKAAGELGSPFGPLFRTLLLTGCRREEVSAMTDEEIDASKRLWTIPGARTKNRRDHMVPLSDAAWQVLEAMPRVMSKAGYVFTTTGETAPSGYSRAKANCHEKMLAIARKEAPDATIEPWQLHDLRRVVSTRMNEALGIEPHVVEAILNHVSSLGSAKRGVAGTYNLAQYLPQKTAALQAWGRWVMALVEGEAAASNVVAIRVTGER